MRRPGSGNPHRREHKFNLLFSFLAPVTKTQEGAVVGFQNFAWTPNLQEYKDSNKKKLGTPSTPSTMSYLGGQGGYFEKLF